MAGKQDCEPPMVDSFVTRFETSSSYQEKREQEKEVEEKR
jgi:hypothetical protein